jgi:hypothetical protein
MEDSYCSRISSIMHDSTVVLDLEGPLTSVSNCNSHFPLPPLCDRAMVSMPSMR